jgi:hypothetical protein
MVDARYYGDEDDHRNYYPGVVVGFSRDGFMVRFVQYENDPLQDTKPEDVRPPNCTNFIPFLLPLGDKRKNKPYTCSVFCEENRFYACGGCPTCNEYYKSIGRRNPYVLLDKRKVMKQLFAPDAVLLEMHYIDVCRKNPTWCKNENGKPIVPNSLALFTVPRQLTKPSKKARIEAAYAAHDSAVHAAAVAEKSKAVSGEPLPYKCSHYCAQGMFAMAGGCPTCNVYYDLIGGINPKVVRGEDIVHEKYNEMILRKHYDVVSKNNPEWTKDEAGNPVVPDTYGKSKA